MHTPALFEPAKGSAAIRDYFTSIAAAFPDAVYEKAGALSRENKVCLEFIRTGTHLGPLPGPAGGEIPATNKRARIYGSYVFKLEGGVITEVHEFYDQLGVMAQLGLTPQE